MPTPAVQVLNLRKSYKEREVLKGVSFEIARGETFALLGPNGAGKSTTVEILEGYRARTSGTVSVLGVDPANANRDYLARIGIVLQSGSAAANITVREQLAQFATYYPNPRDVDELISAVGLDSQAKMRIGKLSGGQQRRVDVALGINGRPEVLFLDEPTTGFDPQARREFWQLIRSLQDEGTTILLTTHYLDEAAQLADRLAVIMDGVVRESGPVATFGGAAARTPIVRWSEAGEGRSERTANPYEFIQTLANRLGGAPDALEVVRPTLEDIYLEMVAS